jgi:Tol biopolymer transport system component
VDRNGKIELLPGDPGPYEDVHLSPDGLTAVVTITDSTSRILRYDLLRGGRDPLTNGGSCQWPIWIDNGKSIVYRRTRNGFRNLYCLRLDGSSPEKQLTEGENLQHPWSVSPDGRMLAFCEIDPETGPDLWLLPLEEGGQVKVFSNSQYDERGGYFSPNGRWLAYCSNRTGREEIWVQPVTGSGEAIQITTEGGNMPQWSPVGDELFYHNRDYMMVVGITYKPTLSPGKHKRLFKKESIIPSAYSVDRDGQRFLLIQQPKTGEAEAQIHLVRNWFEELKQKVPVD